MEGADAVTLLLTAGTDYRGRKHEELTDTQMRAASKKGYTRLRDAHVRE